MWNDEDNDEHEKKITKITNVVCIERVDGKILYCFYTLKVAEKKIIINV